MSTSIFLSCFGTFIYIIITQYDSYKEAAVSLPMIAQRDAVTLHILVFFIEAISKFIEILCGDGSGEDSHFITFYKKGLEIESAILEYQKSYKPIYKAYKNINRYLNTHNFCEYLEDPNGN